MKKSEKLQIGNLYQAHKFKKGWYVYIGSSMNSLVARIERHLSDDKKMHWHIDYLLKSENSEIKDVLFNISDEKIECDLARIIANDGEGVPKFGCSDCNCNSHLIYFKRKKDALESVKDAYDTLNFKYYNLNHFKSEFSKKMKNKKN
ncbi:MAG: DUF123 domain-containing protein [Methanobrevibacter sp.]|nr:DUF123 domain-containing protein [Methanobrevibacter sp.]